ncbi:hypothetical protein [Streptomyces mirabilis]|uniref:hypothetical protein n=1 Tax=Streptomyces mirabilis TaxID=68239 RepID=UPI00224F5B34|nr:hypothetical protein [Streptomyces mirabilis]MCX4429553.1 hypothetical protein [Streptomyces mirabilis]
MRVEQEASGSDRVQRISRPELNRLARRLLLAARQAGRHLDAGRGALTEPVRDVAEAFRELTELIKGGPRAGGPGADATAGGGRRVPPPRVGEGAWLSRTLHDDARRMARAAEAMATSLLSKEFTDKALLDSVGEVPPETPDDEEPLGERMVSAGFDVASYALLEPSDGEAVSRQAVTEATRHSGAGTKAAWSMVQYALGASPLKVVNDATKVIGAGVRGCNARKLTDEVARLAVWLHPDPVPSPAEPDPLELNLWDLLGCSPELQEPALPFHRNSRAPFRRNKVVPAAPIEYGPMGPEQIESSPLPPLAQGEPEIGGPELRGP